jgi:hypothetical protein
VLKAIIQVSRLPFKDRSAKPTATIEKTIPSYVLGIAQKYMESGAFEHSGTKGTERENPVQIFFKNHLPGKFEVVKGETVDLFEKHSPQFDVLIFNGHNNSAFIAGESSLLPAEALLASIEVKSKLTKEEIRKSIEAASKLKQLKPFRKDLVLVRTKGKPANDKCCRYFHSVFAYSSDLAEGNWLQNEHDRVLTVSKEITIEANVIDRLYVVNRGLINFQPDYHIGLIENGNSGKALIRFYMDILNFVIREDARRPLVPYIDYAGRNTKDWIKLEKK